MKKMKILKYVSDLHLELRPCVEHVKLNPLYNVKKSNNLNYLALLGDIGNPYQDNLNLFLEKVSPCYEKIFYLPGNHEYYNLTTNKSKYNFDDELKLLCSKYPNIIYMNNNIYEVDDIKFIGSTLWTNINDTDVDYISKSINDYYKILDDNLNTITVNHTNQWNKESIDFIQKELDTDKKCILLTHHAPLLNKQGQYTAHPKYMNGKNNPAFHNDLSYLIKDPIKVWLFGHTHYTNTFKFNDVIVGTNQLGYKHEELNFNPYAFIDLNKIQ